MSQLAFDPRTQDLYTSPRPSPSTPGLRTHRRGDVDLAVESVDAATGAVVRSVVVSDVSDSSPTRLLRQAQIAAQDDLLRSNLHWDGPEVLGDRLVLHNDVSRWLYSTPALREWRQQLVPSARALFPMQRPEATHLPSGTVVDDVTRGFFVDGRDAIGIRTRAAVLRDVVLRATCGATRTSSLGGQEWVSLACGAAVPVLDALAAADTTGVHLSLVDLDEQALAFAADLAHEQGLAEGRDFTLVHRDLVRGVVVRDCLVSELGEGRARVVDALGIFEYFGDAACVRLLHNAYRMLGPGGVLVVANMLSDRPELHFNRRGVGWPGLHQRSVGQLLDLVRRAGLPLDRTTVTIPQDGVYAVVDITR